MLLAIVVFIGVFLVAALLIAASGTTASEREKQALARLDAVLATEGARPDDELVDLRKQELLSAIPLLNRLLVQLEIAPRLRRLLYQADVKWTPGTLLLAAIGAWACGSFLVYLRTRAVFVSIVLGLIPGAMPFVWLSYKRRIRLGKFEEELPPALDMMVTGLRGGFSLISALALVGKEAPDPIGREFRVCFDEQNYGLELRTAMENLAVRVPIQDVKIIVTAILIQKETGGNLAEVLDKCAHVIRERFRLRREIRTKTAQGRLTGWILSFLPVALAIMLFTVNPEGISLLWKSPMGLKMLLGSAVMTLVGALIIRRIIQIRV